MNVENEGSAKLLGREELGSGLVGTLALLSEDLSSVPRNLWWVEEDARSSHASLCVAEAKLSECRGSVHKLEALPEGKNHFCNRKI